MVFRVAGFRVVFLLLLLSSCACGVLASSGAAAESAFFRARERVAISRFTPAFGF
ncbi:hypothetical protein ECPA3_0413, partial [Escherichia coli PA3]